MDPAEAVEAEASAASVDPAASADQAAAADLVEASVDPVEAADSAAAADSVEETCNRSPCHGKQHASKLETH